MKSLSLIKLALKYHWDAHKSNPANLMAATLGMMVNNVIVIFGLWAMLFDGKVEEKEMTIYFLCLNAIVTISWGGICFFLGGIRALGEYVEEGTLEPMLATPRAPLLLAGISHSIAPALGDIIQGLCNFLVLFFLAPLDMFWRCIFFTFVSTTAFLGLFILSGSIAFFIRRGNTLATLFLECNLGLSGYPTGKIFTDKGRIFLYLTPAAFTGILPMSAIDSGNWRAALVASLAAAAFLWFSIQVFNLGLKRYQSSSYVMARN